jgi:hypothetical protein
MATIGEDRELSFQIDMKVPHGHFKFTTADENARLFPSWERWLPQAAGVGCGSP